MLWKLVYWSEDLGKAWRQYFESAEDVEILEGDICQVTCDAIVSPANSFGFMDGGLDYALSKRFGWDLQKRLQTAISHRPVKELLVGEALIISTGDEQTPWLISAPTMRVPMVLVQSINAYLAMKAILSSALLHNGAEPIKTVAIPGLGTGVGGLPVETAAHQMWMAYKEVVLGEVSYPAKFGEAQGRHVALNPADIMLS